MAQSVLVPKPLGDFCTFGTSALFRAIRYLMGKIEFIIIVPLWVFLMVVVRGLHEYTDLEFPYKQVVLLMGLIGLLYVLVRTSTKK